jgi:hypothetical protein
MTRSSYLAAVLALVLPSTAWGATVCVNPGGTGGCSATLQAAVNAAANGDRIEVAPGTYGAGATIPGNKRLTIEGAGVGVTVFDGNGSNLWGVIHLAPAGRLLTLRNLSIRNFDKGIYAEEGIVLEDCEVSGCADRGIEIQRHAKGVVRRCTITGNGTDGPYLTGGVWTGADSTVSIYASTVRANVGSGVRGDTILIEDSTISDNQNGGPADGSPSLGAGIHGIRVNLKRSTVAGNSVIDPDGSFGGGVVASRLRLDSSIVADNVAAVGPDCSRNRFPLPAGHPIRLQSAGFNLVEDGLVECGGLARPTDLLGVDPMLDSLQDNGGPTETRALLPGSPAIAAITAGSKCRRPDQRGVPRAAPCDMGAFEAP